MLREIVSQDLVPDFSICHIATDQKSGWGFPTNAEACAHSLASRAGIEAFAVWCSGASYSPEIAVDDPMDRRARGTFQLAETGRGRHAVASYGSSLVTRGEFAARAEPDTSGVGHRGVVKW